jgi:hypothetical protein
MRCRRTTLGDGRETETPSRVAYGKCVQDFSRSFLLAALDGTKVYLLYFLVCHLDFV